MKKIGLLFTALSLWSGLLSAQDTEIKKNEKKFFAAISVGPSFPVGNFASKDLTNNIDAGLAKVGYNANLHTGYQLTEQFGLASTIFISKYNVDNDAVQRFLNGNGGSSLNATADHWQYWGISIGPMGTFDLGGDVKLDIKTLLGYARANMPVIRFDLEGAELSAVTPDRWTDAFSWQVGADLRYHFNPSTFFFTNLDYNYIKPKWTYPIAGGGSESYEQKTGVVDFNVGIGVAF